MAEVFWQSKAFWLRPEGTEPTCSSLPPPHPCAQAVPVFPRKKKKWNSKCSSFFLPRALEGSLGLKRGWTGPGQGVRPLAQRRPHSRHLLPATQASPLGSPQHGAFLQAGPGAPACCCHAVATWQRNCLVLLLPLSSWSMLVKRPAQK